MNKKEIGKYLEKLRKAKGLNRTEAARAVGTIYKSVLDWESGVMPSSESLIDLARLYSVTVDDILECGKQITSEELYEKYPIFKPLDYTKKPDLKKDYYTYQTQLIVINNRLKELILAFRKRVLSRSEDFELRFLFSNMCSFSEYYYDHYDNENKDEYLCFIKVLNRAKHDSKSSQEYYFEVRKYIDNKFQYINPFPEYANANIDNIKDKQFKALENWEKDFFLAAIQNSDVINDPSDSLWHLKDYEQRYGEEFDKEKVIKKLIRYFIENGAELNPWLYSFKKKKKVAHDVLTTLEEYYVDYLKPLFIQFHNPNDEEDKEYKYAYVENNEMNRFLDNYIRYYFPLYSADRIDPKTTLELFESKTEKEIVEFLYSEHKKYRNKDETEYRFKKADVENDLQRFYKCRDKLLSDNEKATKRIKQIKELEVKLNNGEKTFYEFEIIDIAKEKEFNHWKLMNIWKNQLTYSQFIKKRDKKLTESLLRDLDKISLDEIRDKYFAKEEVEVKDE